MKNNNLEQREMVVENSIMNNIGHSSGSINAVDSVSNAVITQDLCDGSNVHNEEIVDKKEKMG